MKVARWKYSSGRKVKWFGAGEWSVVSRDHRRRRDCEIKMETGFFFGPPVRAKHESGNPLSGFDGFQLRGFR